MKLDDYRAQMDEIDSKLVRLLEQRMDVSCDIARYKKNEGIPTYDGGREQYKLFAVADLTGNPLYKDHMKKVFEAIMGQSRALQDELM